MVSSFSKTGEHLNGKGLNLYCQIIKSLQVMWWGLQAFLLLFVLCFLAAPKSSMIQHQHQHSRSSESTHLSARAPGDSYTWKNLRNSGISHLALRLSAFILFFLTSIPVGHGHGLNKQKSTKNFLHASHERVRLRTAGLSPINVISTLRTGTLSVWFLPRKMLETCWEIFYF